MYEPMLDMYLGFRKFGYVGSKALCPVCERSFNKFIPAGKVGICPNCSSGSRHRAIYLYLQRRTNFFTDPLKVLHFAPEHCFNKKFRKLPNLEYLSADLGSPRAMEKIDITNIPYPDNYFDVTISSHVLEHIPDDMKAMRELNRVQKKGGWSIHLAPIDYTRHITYQDDSINTDELRQKVYGHHDHKRIYGKDYAGRLTMAGFEVYGMAPQTFLSNAEMLQFGVDKDEFIYLCKK